MPKDSTHSAPDPQPKDKRKAASAEVGTTSSWLTVVVEKVNSVKDGWVQVVVHDGKVVQIETVERTRFERPKSD